MTCLVGQAESLETFTAWVHGHVYIADHANAELGYEEGPYQNPLWHV